MEISEGDAMLPHENDTPELASSGPTVQRWVQIAPVLAVLAAVTAMVAGFGARIGVWHFRTGFTILTWSAYGGILALLISLVCIGVAAKYRQWKTLAVGLIGVIIGGSVVAVPLSWKIMTKKVPPIHDISTDIDTPPKFVAVLPLRQNAPNPSEYGGAEVAVKQRAAYPDIKTIIFNRTGQEAFAKAVDVGRSLGWKLVAEVPAEGRIEASDTTFWFGFTDDIVIRITPAGNRSLVDVRSVSRVGKSDVGTNAERIRAFMKRMGG